MLRFLLLDFCNNLPSVIIWEDRMSHRTLGRASSCFTQDTSCVRIRLTTAGMSEISVLRDDVHSLSTQ